MNSDSLQRGGWVKRIDVAIDSMFTVTRARCICTLLVCLGLALYQFASRETGKRLPASLPTAAVSALRQAERIQETYLQKLQLP